MEDQLNNFINIIRNQFKESEHHKIDENTDIKTLKEWSSLQIMIIVNEIDKAYGVILEADDLKNTSTLKQLFQLVNTKTN